MHKIGKVYFWRLFSLIFNFISFLIITPRLSTSSSIYGIYTSVIFLLLFISFSDFGFIPASIKYGAEAVGQNDRKKEIKIVALSTLITLLMTIIIGLFFLLLSFNPRLLFNDLDSQEVFIAERLYFTLFLIAPIYALKRSVQVIYQIRVEDHIYQMSEILFIVVKIILVMIFFSSSSYQILNYFYSYNLVYFIICLALIIDIKRRYDYDWSYFIKNMKYNKIVFNYVKKLSFALFFASLASILLYQVDMLIISAVFSAKSVGIFAIALTISNYMRNIIGSIFQPFSAILNQDYGKGDLGRMYETFSGLFYYGIPIVTLFVGFVYIFSDNLVLCWVGEDYQKSIHIAKVLVVSVWFLSLTIPIAEYLKVKNQYKKIRSISTFSPFIFYTFCFTIYFYTYDIISFAYGRFFHMLVLSIIYAIIYLKFNEKMISIKINVILAQFLVLIVSILIVRYLIVPDLPDNKSLFNTLIVLFRAFLSGALTLLMMMFCDKNLTLRIKSLIYSKFNL